SARNEPCGLRRVDARISRAAKKDAGVIADHSAANRVPCLGERGGVSPPVQAPSRPRSGRTVEAYSLPNSHRSPTSYRGADAAPLAKYDVLAAALSNPALTRFFCSRTLPPPEDFPTSSRGSANDVRHCRIRGFASGFGVSARGAVPA